MGKTPDIKQLLADRAGFEVVDASSAKNQLRIIGRVPPNASSHWVVIVHHLLLNTQTTTWKVDISRQYFLRESGASQKLFYAWRLIFQSSVSIDEVMPEILKMIMEAPKPSRVEFKEFPLTGAGASRTQVINGRGVGAVGEVPVGPLAAMAALQQRVGGG